MPERIPNHKFHRWLMSAERYESPWRHDNQRCFEYYDGEQWSGDERYEIEQRGQQPTVINTIQPTIDMIRANEVERRSDFQVIGREEGDDGKAQLLTELLKHVFDTCQFDYYHSECFRESLIGGRSWMECSIIQDERGKDVISVSQLPWNLIYVDPFSRKPDASDARFIIKIKWVDRDMAKKLFGESAELIDSVFTDDYHGQEYEAQMNAFERPGSYYDIKSNRVKICECWYTVPENKRMEVLDERTGRKQEKMVLQNAMHYVIFSDEIILRGSADSDEVNKDPVGINMYPLIPLYCQRDRTGLPRGVVSSLISIQDQINKLNSKFLWTIASNRMFVEEGAVRDLDEAREQLQQPDGVVVMNDGGLSKLKVDDKYRDLSYMSQHLAFLLQTEQRISGVNDSMLGLGSTGERSGTMQSVRISQGAAMQTSILENLYFSKQRVAQVCLRLMGKYYTDYRVIRITQPNGMADEYKFNAVVPDGNGNSVMLNEMPDTIYYDVILKKVAPFTSIREKTLMMFSEVMKTGVIPAQVAAKLMLMLADIPNKQDLIMEVENFYKGQQQAAAGAAGPLPETASTPSM